MYEENYSINTGPIRMDFKQRQPQPSPDLPIQTVEPKYHKGLSRLSKANRQRENGSNYFETSERSDRKKMTSGHLKQDDQNSSMLSLNENSLDVILKGVKRHVRQDQINQNRRQVGSCTLVGKTKDQPREFELEISSKSSAAQITP